MVISPKFLFIHVPKAAGSSITTALLREPDASRGAFSYPHYTLEDYCDFFGKEKIQKRFVFCVIRNPWARMYSWWKFNRMRYRQRPARYTDQISFKEKHFEKDFNEWLLTTEFITNEERKFNDQPTPAQKRSQFDWFDSEPDLVDYIGKVEELDELKKVLVMNKVVSDTSSSFSIPHMNKTDEKAPHYTKVYSKEAEHWIEHYFWKDIEYGHYTFM